ncbi:hypothetical protein EDB86DRAFT_2957650 [Lactarius hatsudake]|nr:hypothetical protein EDB86DRAFT_2957650 [Lactarius hatsudake]
MLSRHGSEASTADLKCFTFFIQVVVFHQPPLQLSCHLYCVQPTLPVSLFLTDLYGAFVFVFTIVFFFCWTASTCAFSVSGIVHVLHTIGTVVWPSYLPRVYKASDFVLNP